MNSTATVPIDSSVIPRSGLSGTAVFFTLSGLMLLVALLAVFFFIPQSLRLDEAQSLWVSSRSPDVILALVAEDVHVPLYQELLHFWRLYFGNTVESARLMSLFFYLLSLPAIYALGAAAYSRRVGVIAAVFLAVSPFMNWYGSEIRMYTLLLFLTILNQYLFIRLWKEPSRDAWIWYGITAVLGIYTHYFFFLNLLSQGVFYAMHRPLFAPDSKRRLITMVLILAAAILPWGWYVLSQGEAGNQVPLLTIPTSVDVFNTFSQFLVGFQNDNLNTVFLSLWPAAMLIGFLALRRSLLPSHATRYFLLTILVSFSAAFIFSITVQPAFVSRYLIFTVPSLYLLIAAFLDAYAWRIATWSVAALMLGMMAVEIYNPTAPVKENYKEASSFLTQHARPQDIVVVSVPFTLYPVQYYYRGAAPLSTLPQWNQYAHGAIPSYSQETLPREVSELSQAHQNLWLLQSYDQGYNDEVKQYLDSQYHRLETYNFSPGLNLYKYQLRWDTPLAQLQQPTTAQ